MRGQRHHDSTVAAATSSIWYPTGAMRWMRRGTGGHERDYDHLGTPRFFTDRGKREAGYHVLFPFGEESPDKPSATAGVPLSTQWDSERLRFTGHERDLQATLDAPADDLATMHARYDNPNLGRFLSVDPGRPRLTEPQSWNGYLYGVNSPLANVDPDGCDAIAVVFPEYLIATPIGRVSHLRHAGIVLINNKNGVTRYYEHGCYDKQGKGAVRRTPVPNVVMDKGGVPTAKSMGRLLAAVSRSSGQGGPVEGAYFRNDNFQGVLEFEKVADEGKPTT
ncbi:MAG: hypothetical protein KA072_12845 [Thermoanaerobaculaceae bacterium]|nr:hypothetical protein [Thermoanaerobaculaceae bacterium]MDI9620372.1 RHS repeat-associated core domain-containing protein [Acidobacteriota bacterium]NLH10420.1 hypothetical protein [Holophagae bacterium]HPW56489.1 RHS repeat-associated core domain-containing protein [Thermoanaerobaculaceae bacterium]